VFETVTWVNTVTWDPKSTLTPSDIHLLSELQKV